MQRQNLIDGVLRFSPSSLLPSLAELEHDFRERFGRDMTTEERRLYSLTKDFLELAPAKERRTRPKRKEAAA